jgi:hypothetical protein
MLVLGDCRSVDDAGMPHIARLVDLQFLNLSYSQVTDAGAEYLKTLPRLRGLHLYGSQVSQGKQAELQQWLLQNRKAGEVD